MEIFDLSQEVFTGSPVYRGHQPTVIHRLKTVKQISDLKWTFAVNALFMSDHCGTHTDSFAHMDPNPEARTIEQLPLEMFHGLGVCLDVSNVPMDRFIGKDHLIQALEKSRLDITGNKVVLLYTGHYEKTFPKPAYGEKHVGLNREAMEWLADQGVINVGIDCPSVDIEPHFGDEWKPAHSVCRERGILNTENLGDLTPVVGKQFYYMGLPIRIKGGTAAPIRAVAIRINDEDVETCKFLANSK